MRRSLQENGIPEDVLICFSKSSHLNHVNLDAKEVGQVVLGPSEIEEACSRLELHQEVKIAA